MHIDGVETQDDDEHILLCSQRERKGKASPSTQAWPEEKVGAVSTHPFKNDEVETARRKNL